MTIKLLLRGIGFLLAIALVACSSTGTLVIRPEDNLQYAQRAADLKSLAEWTLDGRLAISNDEDGGSGKLRWRRGESSDQLDFHGALGRGAWSISSGPEGARLQRADGTVVQADSIDQLVERQLGRALPVEALAWWVLGLAAPGEPVQLELDENGFPLRLVQWDWVIEFKGYRESGSRTLPTRIDARQDDWTVKLAIRNWQYRERALSP